MPSPPDLDASTRRPTSDPRSEPARPHLRLTIALHPALRRIGERVEVTADGDGLALSRRTPEFRAPDGRAGGPLRDSFLSRTPITLRPHDGGLLIDRGASSTALRVVGSPDTARVFLDAASLARGVILTLADRVVLHLQSCPAAEGAASGHGLIGASPAIEAVRHHIDRCAELPVPVLIHGESGTGKELVARAIYAASPRAARPYIPINMAALHPHTAIAELFGHARGAFTGAIEARDGLFRAADGGTIFLDELGATSLEIQAMLLRVLEVGEIQPIGGAPARRVDVRVVAATDADLTQAIRRGEFRSALFHRLATYTLPVPPLRVRRDDIAPLFVHCLAAELRRAGRPERFDRLAEDALQHLPVAAMLHLLAHPWPGNVRELRNVAARTAAALLAGDDIADIIHELGDPTDEPIGPAASEPQASAPPDEQLRVALEEHDWQIAPAARSLGISRTTLYARIKRSERLHTAHDFPAEVLTALYERHGGDPTAIADALRISVRALKLRLRALGLIR